MNCPICNSNSTETSFINPIFNQANYYCDHCDYYFIGKEKDVSEYYKTDYHSNFGFKNTKKKYNLLYYFSKPRNYARFKYFLNSTKNTQFKSFLEIGGGNSDNYVIFDSKYDIEKFMIVEPNPNFNLKRANLHYFNCLFEDVPLEQLNNTEVVIMYHVLEHIYDLTDFFQKIKSLKCKYLYFEVPNIGHEKVKVESLTKHPHYHHFSKKSLELLFEKNGIKNYKIDTINPITYHPYNKPPVARRIVNKILKINEEYNPKGLYLRGLINFQ